MKSLAFLLLPVLCLAAEPPAEIKGVIDLAHGAPGEFAADALIRVAALDTLEKPLRIQLLTGAFQRAAEAQQPYKRHAAITRASSARFLNHAYGQDMDALSLRLRAIQGMLPLDSGRAREMFLDMPPLDLPRVPCDDFMAYDVSRFYETLSEVARRGFTPKEIAKGDPVHMLQQYLGMISSPAQVGPAAKLLANAGLSDADFESLLGAYAGALGKIPEDDRSFTDNLSAGARIVDLIDAAKRRKASPLPLIESYRLYLVNHLSAARCADDDLMQPGGSGPSSPPAPELQAADAAGFFNAAIRMPPLQPIQDKEATPSKLEGAASDIRSCEDAGCRAIQEQFRSLVFESQGSAYSDAQRSSPEWQDKLSQFLSSMAEWQDSAGMSPAAQFREKCSVFGDVYGIAPNGPGRELVQRSLLEYLQRSQSQAANRLEWFLPVDALVGRSSLDPLGTGGLTEALRKASDPVIALYAELETIAPRGPGVLMGLL